MPCKVLDWSEIVHIEAFQPHVLAHYKGSDVPMCNLWGFLMHGSSFGRMLFPTPPMTHTDDSETETHMCCVKVQHFKQWGTAVPVKNVRSIRINREGRSKSNQQTPLNLKQGSLKMMACLIVRMFLLWQWPSGNLTKHGKWDIFIRRFYTLFAPANLSATNLI